MAGILGDGVKVGYATGSPHTWKKLELLLDVKFSTLKADKLDKTTHGTARFKRNMAGMQDVTDAELTFLRDPYTTTSPNQNALFGLLAAQTTVWWRFENPADPDLATTLFEAYEYQGRVGSFEPASPIMDKQTMKAVIVFDSDSFVRYEPYATVLN